MRGTSVPRQDMLWVNHHPRSTHRGRPRLNPGLAPLLDPPWIVDRPTVDPRWVPLAESNHPGSTQRDLWSHFVDFSMGQLPGLCWLTKPGSANPGSTRRPRGSSYHVSTWVGGLTVLGLLETGDLRPSFGLSLRCKMYGGWGSGFRI